MLLIRSLGNHRTFDNLDQNANNFDVQLLNTIRLERLYHDLGRGLNCFNAYPFGNKTLQAKRESSSDLRINRCITQVSRQLSDDS